MHLLINVNLNLLWYWGKNNFLEGCFQTQCSHLSDIASQLINFSMCLLVFGGGDGCIIDHVWQKRNSRWKSVMTSWYGYV